MLNAFSVETYRMSLAQPGHVTLDQVALFTEGTSQLAADGTGRNCLFLL